VCVWWGPQCSFFFVNLEGLAKFSYNQNM
jgi:hypothetical protein